MLKHWTVYKHTFPNGKIYIGITGMTPEKRWCNGHGYIGRVNGQYKQPLIANAIIKYGWSNILHEIVADGLSEKEASKIEADLIAKYKSNDYKFGYNVTDGGLGGKSIAMREYAKKVSQPTKCNETGVIYPSLSEASRQTGVCISSVRKSCNDGSVYCGLSFSRVRSKITEKEDRDIYLPSEDLFSEKQKNAI